MKSTYDLLSIFLDNQDLPKPAPKLIPLFEVPECAELGDDYNFLDLPFCRRKISGLKLLSSISAADTTSFVDTFLDCKEIIISLDYSSASRISCALYLKRVLQAISCLSQSQPDIVIMLAGDVQKWTELLRMIYAER